jgi:hypothetical protein
MVRVGLGGDKNFAWHEGGKQHQKKLAAQTSIPKRQSTFMVSFFAKKPPLPCPSNSANSQLSVPPIMLASITSSSSIPKPQVPSELEPINVDSFPDTATPSIPPTATDHLLNRLWVLASNLPNSVLAASPDNVFACFAHDLCSEIEEGDDPYEATVDHTLSNAVGYEKDVNDVAQFICRGPLGMDAFCRCVEICLVDLNIAAGLLEVRVGRVCEVMKLMYVTIYWMCCKHSRDDPVVLTRQTIVNLSLV